MREGLRRAIEKDGDMVVVAAARDGMQAVELHRVFQPDITLMDLQMPRLDGLGAVAAIKKLSPGARFALLTSYAGDARVRRAFDSGVSAYLLKTSPSTVLRSALREAIEGKLVIDPAISLNAAIELDGGTLTAREISVLKHVAEGDSNARIGIKLSVTEYAVKARIRTILHKLDAQDRTHAVTIARQRGFIDL